ncbi:MAG: dGTP triphosphohydrolase [Planctomycetota bacterium]
MSAVSEPGLAPYAVRSVASGGRRFDEPPDPLRSSFELDRRRIISCTAFRRLEHKTQVFAPRCHDHFRTRLTHTLEAADVARCLAGALRVNAALAEAVVLAHDLGHPPFGHAGEAALREAMRDHGGFNHNAHSLRVVDELEHPFPNFRGLNLTRETREGLMLHVTRYDEPSDGRTSSRSKGQDLSVARGTSVHGSVEAQVASLADRIAYNCHDLEDAIGAGFLDLRMLAAAPLWQSVFEEVVEDAEGAQIHAVRRAVLDGIVDRLLRDAVATSRSTLAAVHSPEEAVTCTHPLVILSTRCESELSLLEAFLLDRVYRHPDIARSDSEGMAKLRAVFDFYRQCPREMPRRFSARIDEQGLDEVICDYIAGMTDRFCEAEYARLVGR